MKTPAMASLLVTLLLSPALAGDDLHVVSVDTNKERVLLLLEDELVAIGKWPLQVQLFETAELAECHLEHTKVIDLKKIRIKRNADPKLPYLLLCGSQMVTGRRVEAVTVAPSGEIAPESQPWRVESQEATMTVHWRESEERQWAIIFRRP